MASSGIVEVTAAEATDLAARAAAGLRRLGLRDGDVVAFCAEGTPALLGAVLGAARSGLRPAVLNPALTAPERAAQVAQLGEVTLIDGGAAVDGLLGDVRADLAPFPLVRPMHFTSGTTGVAKAVTSGMPDEVVARAQLDDELETWALDASDTLLMCSPLQHSVALRFATTVFAAGGSLLMAERFDAATTLGCLRSGLPTAAFAVPTHLQRLLTLQSLGQTERFASLRFLAHAGSSCPPATKRDLLDRVGGRGVVEFYGASETQFTICEQADWLERPGTVGRARRGRTLSIRPTDETGDEGIGTIWCEVPAFARWSYLNRPDETAAAWDGDACTVGDLGSVDADGFLTLGGRRQDLIITGGVNVYPAEVEATLAGVDGVAEVAVFGVDDPTWGQRVCCAFVGDADAETALAARAAVALASFKRPKSYARLDALPMTVTGKVLRRLLPEAVGLQAERLADDGRRAD